jgi:HemY protein
MKAWRWALLLIVVLVLGALAWGWLAPDPGYVLIRFHGWRIEATVVGAVFVLVAAWVGVAILWWLLRWPFGALTRRHRRLSRKRLQDGLIALAEGRHAEAARALQRASQHAPLRPSALLAAAEAAHRHGDTQRALEALDEAAQRAPDAARILRARVLRENGRAEEALQLLAPAADTGKLPPGGWHEYALAALDAGQPARARAALEPLRKSDMLGSAGYNALASRVLVASLRQSADAGELQQAWRRTPRAQRAMPEVLAAYARRAGELEDAAPALDEIESFLQRDWSPVLVTAYGDAVAPDAAAARLRNAGRWLDAHPNDDVLLLALGKLSMRAGQLPRAREYLVRALALKPSAGAWEALGDVQAAAGERNDATRCYANALRCRRGENIAPAPREAGIDTAQFAVEERDQHGVPRIPDQPPHAAP